jgi:hypothetical protein
MKVLREGHKYLLNNFEEDAYLEMPTVQIIQFIEKVPRKDHPDISPMDSDPNELITLNNGTTNEEVIKVLMDRLKYLNNKFPCVENEKAYAHLDDALAWLNKRTKDRQERGVEGKAEK